MSVTIPEHALGYFRRTLARFMEMAEREPALTEFSYNGGGEFEVDIGGELYDVEEHAIDDDTVLSLGGNAAVSADAEFNADHPFLSVMIPPDWRASFWRPPAVERPSMSLRKLLRVPVPLAKYVEDRIMTWEQKLKLEALVAEHKTIIISGGTATGKTTLLRALLELIPYRNTETARAERIVSIEDARELMLTAEDGVTKRPHWLPLCAAPPRFDMAACLRSALRARPNRIIVGEVRGPEALELVRAINTGHAGAMCSVHSNGREEAIDRIYDAASAAQSGLQRSAVERGIDAVVQITGMGKQRRISEIWERGHAAD